MHKSKIVSGLMIGMTVILLIAIAVVGYMITRPISSTSTAAPRKTKAQFKTYQKLITFNRTITPEPSEPPLVTSPTSPTTTSQLSPTPTEIVLARASTPTPAAISPTSAIQTATWTIAPTRINNLPESGTVTTALFIFAAAGLMIFFSFLF